MDKNELTQAYDAVIEATEKAVKAGIDYDLKKESLDGVIAIAISKGDIVGKNEQERKAAAFVIFDQKYEALSAAEIKYRELKLDLDIAKLRLDCKRDILRIEELAKD
jgi:hypothetical protein